MITPNVIPLYELFAPKYKPEELAQLCESLNVDYYNLGGTGRQAKALSLQQYLAARSRLHELVAKLHNDFPQEDFSPYLYLVIAEQFSTEDRIITLLKSLGIDKARNFGGSEKFAWGSGPWINQKALALQAHLEENGRTPELLGAIRHRNPDVDLTFYDETAVPDAPSPPPSGNGPESSPPIEFANFDVGFVYRADGRLTVKVSDSPKGEKSADDTYELNLTDVDLQDRIAYLRGLIARRDDAEKLGVQLRLALLPDEIMSHLENSLTEAKIAGKDGLRVRLRLGLKQTELGQIPWEYCRDERGFLALNTQTPFVRYLETDRPAYQPMTVPGKVRVLVAIAAPGDQAQLDVTAEADRIKDALAKLNNVTLKTLEHTNPENLFESIHYDFKPHILHFIGHGDLKEDGEGALVLEDGTPEKKSHLVDASDLMQLLQATEVKLVVLSACLTAAYEASTAIMGVAPRLVWAGLPAVIAMQFAVPDKTAVAFAGDFYRFLAAGEPLDGAMTKARLGTFFKGKDKVFWGIPVLFMRTPDGRLWLPQSG